MAALKSSHSKNMIILHYNINISDHFKKYNYNFLTIISSIEV